MFWRSERGTITVATVILLPGVLLGAAMVYDLLKVNNHRTYLQGQADMAALEAVRYAHADEAALAQAQQSVSFNHGFDAHELVAEQVVLGRWEERDFTPHDPADPRRANAAHVTVRSVARTKISSAFRAGFDAPVARSATAVMHERVSFSLSNCLASLDLFRGALQPLLGLQTDVLCSDGALNLRTDALLNALALDLEAPLTYGDVLDADIGLLRLWSIVLGLDVPVPPGRIRLADVLYLDEASRGLALGAELPGATVDGADLVFASLELLSMNAVNLDLRVDLGGLANIPLSLTVLEPRRIVSSVEPGSPEAYAETAQIRLGIHGLDLLGLVQLDLGLEIAHASAQLAAEGSLCRPDGQAAAVFDPVTAGLVALEVNLRIPGLTLQDEIGLVQTENTDLRFTPDEIREGTAKEVSPRLEGTLNSVAYEVTGLLDQLPLGGLGSLVGGVLGGLASLLSPVEALLGAIVHDFVGLAIAPASLTVTDASCEVRLVR